MLNVFQTSINLQQGLKADGIMGLAPSNQGTGTNMIYGGDSLFSFSVG